MDLKNTYIGVLWGQKSPCTFALSKHKTMSETKTKILRRLFEENELVQEDTFIMTKNSKDGTAKKIPMITRSGIDKIQAKQGISITYQVETINIDRNACVIRAIGIKGNAKIETFGSAIYAKYDKESTIPSTTTNSHYVEIAEKRARARCVLMLAGFYQHGVHGEGENLDD